MKFGSSIRGWMKLAALIAAGSVAVCLSRPFELPNASAQIAPDQSFNATIALLVAQNPVSVAGLWNVKAFAALSSMGEAGVDAAIALLSSNAASIAEKNMAVMAMYGLSRRDYVVFLTKLTGLYDRKLVDGAILSRAVNVPDAFSVELQKHYGDPDVARALHAIQGRDGVSPETKQNIADILSGKAWRATQAFCLDHVFDHDPDCRLLGWLDLF
jgi:hypothetical protein